MVKEKKDSKIDFITYYATLQKTKEMKQLPTSVITEHSKDSLTYDDMTNVLNLITKDFRTTNQVFTTANSVILNAFAKILIDNKVASPEEVKDALSQVQKQVEEETKNTDKKEDK